MREKKSPGSNNECDEMDEYLIGQSVMPCSRNNSCRFQVRAPREKVHHIIVALILLPFLGNI